MFSSVVIPNLRRFFASAICCRNAFPLLQFKIKLLPFRSRRRFDAEPRYAKPTVFFLEQTIEQLLIFVFIFSNHANTSLNLQSTVFEEEYTWKSVKISFLLSLDPSPPSLIIIRPLDPKRRVLCSLHSFICTCMRFTRFSCTHTFKRKENSHTQTNSNT